MLFTQFLMVVAVAVAVVVSVVAFLFRFPESLFFFLLKFSAELRPPLETELVVGHILGHDQAQVDIVTDLLKNEMTMSSKLFGFELKQLII